MRIALVGRDADRVLAFRGSLVRMAQRQGHAIVSITGPATPDEGRSLEAAGIAWRPVPMSPSSLNPLQDLAYRGHVARTLSEERIDAVLAYNPKCVAHVPSAARRAGVRRVVTMVTGLGYGFIGRSMREALVRRVKAGLFRGAFALSDSILVQNSDDLRALLDCGALTRSMLDRVHEIAGSGVDLREFPPRPMPAGAHFLMMSRPLRDKGLPAYLEAAGVAAARMPDASFSWLGPLDDPNPSAMSRIELTSAMRRCGVRHVSPTRRISDALAACSVFVLPSLREGTSKAMLEAMATGRPVITTDAPGCGTVIEHGQSGLIVPARDVPALAEAMLTLGRSGDARTRMGAGARKRVESRYDAIAVDAVVLSALVGS
jgi:glycosyltransferase involved in cell wall biosynthesis